jgi:micrococcal nuclease
VAVQPAQSPPGALESHSRCRSRRDGARGCWSRCGRPLQGAVAAYIGDGDSLCVQTSAGLVEVRIADFRAAELNDPGGAEAKAALNGIAMGRTAICRAGDRSYDRVVAMCTIGGQSVGALMRRAGVPEGGR